MTDPEPTLRRELLWVDGADHRGTDFTVAAVRVLLGDDVMFQVFRRTDDGWRLIAAGTVPEVTEKWLPRVDDNLAGVEPPLAVWLDNAVAHATRQTHK